MEEKFGRILLHQAVTGHFGGLLDAEQVQQRGGDIGQDTIAQGDGVLIRTAVDEVYQVGGVSGVGRAIRVQHVLAAAQGHLDMPRTHSKL